jgi:hypothetical protein
MGKAPEAISTEPCWTGTPGIGGSDKKRAILTFEADASVSDESGWGCASKLAESAIVERRKPAISNAFVGV